MTDFDKYRKEGAYHWAQTDPRHPRFNPPLLARYQALLRYAPAKADCVLDVGCGDGYLTHQLSLRGYRRVTGLDYEAVGVRLARAKLDENADDSPILRASAYALPLASASVDLITHADVIEHLTDPAQALAEMSRVLRTGGCLLVSTPNWSPTRPVDRYHVQEFKPSDLEALYAPHFRHVRFYACWRGDLLRLWKRRGRGAMWINRLARWGWNPLAITSTNPTPLYEQLLTVATK
jgi:SAM-dependent methyltransferase